MGEKVGIGEYMKRGHVRKHRKSGEITTMRHGPRKGEELDPERLHEMADSAEAKFEMIKRATEGSVFTFYSSPKSRTRQTADLILERLLELVEEHPESNVVAITSAEKIPRGSKKRYIVTDIETIDALIEPAPPGVGYVEGQWNEASAREYREWFGGGYELADDYVTQLWMSRKSELKEMRRAARVRIKKMHPEISRAELDRRVRSLSPAKLWKTPELDAMRQLRAFRDLTISLQNKYPGRAVFPTIVGHSMVLDTLTMALLGRQINRKNFLALGGLRRYLEESTLKIDEKGRVVFSTFRNGSFVEPIPVDSVIERLEKDHAERKKEWAELASE